MTEVSQIVSETRSRREEACALLSALHAARDSAVGLAASGASDMFRSVTGESSMDRAIDRTRRLIASFDRVLDELGEGLSEEDLRLLAEIEREETSGVASGLAPAVSSWRPEGREGSREGAE